LIPNRRFNNHAGNIPRNKANHPPPVLKARYSPIDRLSSKTIFNPKNTIPPPNKKKHRMPKMPFHCWFRTERLFAQILIERWLTGIDGCACPR
jgi:hypothetical protein